MKHLLLTLGLIIAPWALAETPRGAAAAWVGLILEQEEDPALQARATRERQGLQAAKFALINGKVGLAQHHLRELRRGDVSRIEPILARYAATAEFLAGRWETALAALKHPALSRSPGYGRVCNLKVLTLVALRMDTVVAEEWRRCRATNAVEASQGNLVWMDMLVALADGRAPGIAETTVLKNPLYNLDNNELKVMLKLALFVNQEKLVMPAIDTLDYQAVVDEELRGIIAHLYYRGGQLVRAWKFMEGLSGPNLENIRGNIWLMRGNQELAYAQYKLALKQKSNSHNAAERALPLAWSLKQWQEGGKLAGRMYVWEGNRLQQHTLSAAFAVQAGEWDAALVQLQQVFQGAGEATPLEALQLGGYVALQRKDKVAAEKLSAKACEAGDTISCWVLVGQSHWGSVPVLMARTDEIEAKGLWRELASETPATVFKDEPLVDQRDIDELDDAMIKLIK